MLFLMKLLLWQLRYATKKTIEVMNQEVDAGVQDAGVAASNRVVSGTLHATVLEKVNNIIGIPVETVTVSNQVELHFFIIL